MFERIKQVNVKLFLLELAIVCLVITEILPSGNMSFILHIYVCMVYENILYNATGQCMDIQKLISRPFVTSISSFPDELWHK